MQLSSVPPVLLSCNYRLWYLLSFISSFFSLYTGFSLQDKTLNATLEVESNFPNIPVFYDRNETVYGDFLMSVKTFKVITPSPNMFAIPDVCISQYQYQIKLV